MFEEFCVCLFQWMRTGGLLVDNLETVLCELVKNWPLVSTFVAETPSSVVLTLDETLRWRLAVCSEILRVGEFQFYPLCFNRRDNKCVGREREFCKKAVPQRCGSFFYVVHWL